MASRLAGRLGLLGGGASPVRCCCSRRVVACICVSTYRVSRRDEHARAMMYYVTVLYFLGEALAGQKSPRGSKPKAKAKPRARARTPNGEGHFTVRFIFHPDTTHCDLPFFVISKSFFVSHFNTHQSSHARSFVPFIFLFSCFFDYLSSFRPTCDDMYMRTCIM